MKLNWSGVRTVSEKGKEVIEELLERRGEIAIAFDYMPRATARKIAKTNSLSLDYKNILRKGKMTEHYIFRVDHQLLLQKKLKQRRQWSFIRNLIVASVVVYLLSLFTLVFLNGG